MIGVWDVSLDCMSGDAVLRSSARRYFDKEGVVGDCSISPCFVGVLCDLQEETLDSDGLFADLCLEDSDNVLKGVERGGDTGGECGGEGGEGISW
jgi:hypothetical protein